MRRMIASPRTYHLAAAGLILLSVGLNLAYLLCDCPLDLAPDEAHYWHWSRHLDWSYYSKGPLVAWLIRGSCDLFGDLSMRLVGTEMLAVRLPAVASNAALLAGLYVLTSAALRSPRAGLAVVAVALTYPPASAAAVVMTIDAPYLACWCWALVGAMKAISTGRFRWWLVAGVCSGLGVLAKYPMLLFPTAIAGFLGVHGRSEFRRSGFWWFLLLSLLGCLPVVLWNADREWVSVRHVLGQSGLVRPMNPSGPWTGPLGFAASQFGFLLGFGFVAFAAAGWKYRRTADPALTLLWWASVPVWGFFASASVRTGVQLNWPAAAYIGGSVLATAWVREHLAHPRRRWWIVSGLGSTVALGTVLTVSSHYPGLMRQDLAQVAGPPTAKEPCPVRRLDPTCRLRGWRTLAAEVDSIRDRVRRESGHEPALAGMVWTTPGELAFYCRGRPEAYSFGLALADRHSQYDLWRPNPVLDAQVFRGRSFVYVGEEIPGAESIFDRVEPPIRVVHAEAGVPVAAWTVWVCHGFRGFGPPRASAGY
jgi:hypothetical protein